MATENKIQFGLRNCHYAPFTEEGEEFVYEKPKRIPGGVSLTLSPAGENVEFYADDYLYYGEEVNNGYDGELEIARLMEEFRQDCLGEEIVDGVIYENADAKKRGFALMFEFQGDKSGTRHVLYNCKASRPNMGSSTKTATTEPQTQTLTFTARPRPSDKLVKANTVGASDAVYNNWFNDVQGKPTVPTA